MYSVPSCAVSCHRPGPISALGWSEAGAVAVGTVSKYVTEGKQYETSHWWPSPPRVHSHTFCVEVQGSFLNVTMLNMEKTVKKFMHHIQQLFLTTTQRNFFHYVSLPSRPRPLSMSCWPACSWSPPPPPWPQPPPPPTPPCSAPGRGRGRGGPRRRRRGPPTWGGERLSFLCPILYATVSGKTAWKTLLCTPITFWGKIIVCKVVETAGYAFVGSNIPYGTYVTVAFTLFINKSYKRFFVRSPWSKYYFRKLWKDLHSNWFPTTSLNKIMDTKNILAIARKWEVCGAADSPLISETTWLKIAFRNTRFFFRTCAADTSSFGPPRGLRTRERMAETSSGKGARNQPTKKRGRELHSTRLSRRRSPFAGKASGSKERAETERVESAHFVYVVWNLLSLLYFPGNC